MKNQKISLRVLMLVHRLNLGGTETYVLSLARALAKLGVRVGVATFGGPLVPLFKSEGIRIHLLKMNKRELAPSLSSIIASRDYQIVHAHTTVSFGWLSQLPQNKKGPAAFITVHGRYHTKQSVRQAAARSHNVVAVSPSLADWTRRLGVPDDKIVHIPNGIDTSHFRPAQNAERWKSRLRLPKGIAVVGYTGRMTGVKLDVARKVIAAARRIAGDKPVSCAVLAGPGRSFAMLQKSAEQENRRLGRQAIIVRPAMRQIRQLYWASDVVIGTGRVALEAMACAKPVVAAGAAGYFGVVTPETMTAAIRVHFGDHEAQRQVTVTRLARDTGRLLSDKTLAESLGKYGRQIVRKQFSLQDVARRLLRLYRSK